MADSSSQAKTSADTSKKVSDAPKSAIKNPLVWGFSFVLLVIIVVAFVVAPIYSPIAANDQKIVFGTYDGAEIAYKSGNYFASQYDNYKSNSSASGTDNVQSEYSALRSAFDATVTHNAIIKMNDALGVSVSDSKVNAQVAGSPLFQENGKFSKERFAKINALEIRNMQNLAREDMIQNRIVQDMVNGALVPAKETEFIKNMARLERSFEYVMFATGDYPDAEVSKYAQDNAKLFRGMDLSVITVAKKADADSYRQQIADKKATFEDTAKNHSTDMFKSSSGVRGAVSFHELKLDLADEKLADQVFSLKKGDLSEAIAVPGGFAIYRADSDVRAPALGDTAGLKQVRDYMSANEKGKIEDYLNAQAKILVEAARKDGLDKAAKSGGKKVELTNSFPINYGSLNYPTMYGNFPVMADPETADQKPLGNASTNEAFFNAAFRLKKAEISDPLVLDSGIVVLKLKEEKQLDDAGLGLFANFAPAMANYFVSTDLQAKLVDKTKLVDNFDKTFIAHFMPKN
jgi:parvulin-like peptidyl-prolyl isomerase